ncbi:MAG: Gfo/Idh/MocA family oxidoreductase [Chthonomonadales bacterium]|nr:Gfo/Idh/MocA family oxidoreductase [Chthonomonadales bacterium]
MTGQAPLRFGVIGAGWFASRRHIPDIAAHPEAALAAVCRRDREALERVRAHFGVPAAHADWREMLEREPLDAVVIATPPALHHAQAAAAIERGLHVLLEKPMTIRHVESVDLVARASERGVFLAVALNPPYWAHCHRLREAIRSGTIGEVEAIDLCWTGNAEYVFGEAPRPADLPGVVPPTMYRADPSLSGGGYLIDGGSHLVSEVLWVAGRRAVRVACLADALPSDRRAALAMELEGGATATLTCVGNSRLGERRVRNTIAGSAGTIVVEGFGFDTRIRTRDGREEGFSERDLPPATGPIANLVDAIRGRAPLHSPAEHGADVACVIEAAYRSAAGGAAVVHP